MQAERFETNPLIWPHMDSRIGENVNGPSLVRAPDWLPNRLGRYYLYFAHHKGTYIRLAYADDLRGPWRTYEPGTLQLAESHCRYHVASPDVHVDDERRQIRMCYHGIAEAGQKTLVALSDDGLRFTAMPQLLGDSYFRVFQWQDAYYAFVMPGVMSRSTDGLAPFEPGPRLFSDDMRHSAVAAGSRSCNLLHVFYSNAHDCPERILHSQIALGGDWRGWRASEPMTLIEPELDYEGVDLPLEPSKRGWAPEPVRQLRDPAIYVEDGRVYLLYSVAGEHGIAGAEMRLP